ncbi:MAG: hypothetical protein WCG82_00850 [Bacteroidota bacterium]
MNWNNILTFFISASAITGAFVYIGKRIVDKSLDIALEKYKSTLALELETHKKQLDKVLVEHQIKFGKLHQDRLDVIKLIHNKLYDLEKALRHLTTISQKEERDLERENYAINELENLKDLLEINQIYFNEEVCNRIEDTVNEGERFLSEMISIKNRETRIKEKFEKYNKEFANSSAQSKPIFNDWIGEDTVIPFNDWVCLELEVRMKIKKARFEMTNEFRKLIGVD